MFDTQKLLDQFLGSNSQDQNADAPARSGSGIPDAFKGFGGGLAAGGLAGLLLGTKKGRKMAGTAAKVGVVAVLGGLAYKAYNVWQSSKAGGSTTSQTSEVGTHTLSLTATLQFAPP